MGSATASNELSRTDRDLLQNYLDDIVDMSVLEADEQIELLRDMESAEGSLRGALARIPGTARALVERWNERRERGLVTGALSRWHRDGSNRDLNKLIDEAFSRIESALAAFERPARDGSKLPQARLAALEKSVLEAEVALPVLLEIFESLLACDDLRKDRRFKKTLDEAAEYRAQLTDSKNRFISHNLRLVIHCAKNYRNQGVPFLDLIQEGNVGLIRAVEKFDYRRGYKFSTYAIWWIEQSLVRSVANDARAVRIPSPLLDQRRKLKQIEGLERAVSAAEPSRSDLIERLGLDPDEADDLRRSFSPEVSTQALLGQTESLTLEETLVYEKDEDIADNLDSDALGARIREIIPTLDEREQRVIEARFGLWGDSPRTLHDIGRELGVSRERVRQIEIRALEQLSENQMVQTMAEEIGCR